MSQFEIMVKQVQGYVKIIHFKIYEQASHMQC